MPRSPRIQFPDAYYHVYSRGNHQEPIFRTLADYHAFENFMLEARDRSGVTLFNWNQIANHFHFNLATPDGNLAEFMQRLLTRYAMYFNRTYGVRGHLFQGRYGARLVDRDSYFMELIRYVELNPYRVNGRPLADLGRWRWSSLHYLMKPQRVWPPGCRSAFRRVLGAFDEDVLLARRKLLAFLADGLESKTWEDFYQPKEGRFVGDDEFVERMKSLDPDPERRAARAMETRIQLKDLIRLAEEASGFRWDQLRGPDKSQRLSRWRQAVVYLARVQCRLPLVDLAHAIGRKQPALSMMLLRRGTRIEGWPEFAQLVERLRAANVKM